MSSSETLTGGLPDTGQMQEIILKDAMTRFSKELMLNTVWETGVAETIVVKRSEEATELLAELKKNANQPLSNSLQEKLRNFYLGLNTGIQLCTSLKVYENSTPALDQLKADDNGQLEQLKNNFRAAYQQTLTEHIALAKLLLSQKSSPSKTKVMASTTSRINNLAAYVTDPGSPQKFAAVVADANKLDKLKKGHLAKRVAGGLAKLIGGGLMILSVVLGVGSAASLFVVGPAGLAGMALSMGLTVSGKALYTLGTKLLYDSKIKNAVFSTSTSIRLFAPKTDKKSFLSTSSTMIPPTPIQTPAPATVTPITPANTMEATEPLLAPPIKMSTRERDAAKNTVPTPAVNFVAEHIIKKIEPTLTSDGWKISPLKQVNNANIREVTSSPNAGTERKFTIGEKEVQTNDNDVETFKMMLKCVKTNDTDLPKINTSDALKDKWLQAFKEIYSNTPAAEIDKAITIKSAVLAQPQPGTEPPSPHL